MSADIDEDIGEQLPLDLGEARLALQRLMDRDQDVPDQPPELGNGDAPLYVPVRGQQKIPLEDTPPTRLPRLVDDNTRSQVAPYISSQRR